MSQKTKFTYGISLANKPVATKLSKKANRPALFGGDEDDSDEGNGGGVFGRKKGDAKNSRDDAPTVQAITELGDDFLSIPTFEPERLERKNKLAQSKGNLPPTQPPPSKYKAANAAADAALSSKASSRFGSDLASALTARKHTEAAETLDPSVYDYDASYDALKAAAARKSATDGDESEANRRKPQYMTNIRKMAEVRERDRRIAEDKKTQRERDAEGDAFDDKETFVTEAYKQQQEEHKRLEEAERKREEAEAAKAAETGAMTGFYKQLLERDEQRQAAIQEAIEIAANNKEKDGNDNHVKESDEKDSDATARAREINAHGGNVAVNDEGEVVDKRQLLQGGLNISARKRSELERQKELDARERARGRGHGRPGNTGSHGNSEGYFADGKQGMRDRQSRMLAAQYEQALKRTRDEEEERAEAAEQAAKSRKTTTDISSAKERYLARKRAEAEAKTAGSGAS
ncbi:hypothetical protein SEPCBS57363_003191 [Sporothrix epigloea]|uniref:Nuclear speckle splicing regulatory protein 1 N-terminal domain-containing protein n=1 Tax=Sporothrix epigloea TaxID=1892477 RepID=A0ABP0DM31_9PEZI